MATNKPRGRARTGAWEYCIVSCTPMPTLEEGGARIVGQVFGPDGVRELDVRTDERSPLDALARVLNELGQTGWELVAYDTSTNRGVFKRPGPCACTPADK